MTRVAKSHTAQTHSDAEIHHLIAGELCLDFANTLYGHDKTPIHEYLNSYRDLVLWSQHAGRFDQRTADVLLRKAERFPNEALVVFHRAIALRETLFRLFDAVANHKSPSNTDLAALDAARIEAISHSHLVRTAKSFTLDWNDQTALDQMLWEIAVSAADLMTSDRLALVRECSGDLCDWLFVDTSRNHMRRWCSMSMCGNRAKVRRFAHRKLKRTA
ncbi:MAG: ABATE domain-containing protein [Chloroflexi bacterium]|nr:ABATE domain-containing protein [Chloroflexota bacterium]